MDQAQYLRRKNKKTASIWRQLIFCDPAGIRTQDPYIKSVLLYQLSYQVFEIYKKFLSFIFCSSCLRLDSNQHILRKPPPQDGVSTNFTMSALFALFWQYLTRCSGLRGRWSGLCRRGLLNCWLIKIQATFLLGRKPTHGQTSRKEYGCS